MIYQTTVEERSFTANPIAKQAQTYLEERSAICIFTLKKMRLEPKWPGKRVIHLGFDQSFAILKGLHKEYKLNRDLHQQIVLTIIRPKSSLFSCISL
jgi:hypothetical protein